MLTRYRTWKLNRRIRSLIEDGAWSYMRSKHGRSVISLFDGPYCYTVCIDDAQPSVMHVFRHREPRAHNTAFEKHSQHWLDAYDWRY